MSLNTWGQSSKLKVIAQESWRKECRQEGGVGGDECRGDLLQKVHKLVVRPDMMFYLDMMGLPKRWKGWARVGRAEEHAPIFFGHPYNIRNEYIRRTAQVEDFGDKVE